MAIFEANETTGGGVRSAELTLPGFVHDVCSAVYPLGIGSPFFCSLPLEHYGLEWIQSPAALAHPFDDGTTILVERQVEKTAAGLGADSASYRKIFAPLCAEWESLSVDVLAPPRWPRHPVKLAHFGLSAIQPARRFAERRFSEDRTRARFAGLAAHSMLPLEQWGSAAFGLVLGATAHALGWPIVRGGGQRLASALHAYLSSLGGKIFLNRPVRDLSELPTSRVVLCDVTPRQLVKLTGARLPSNYREKLKNYKYGMGVFKMDWALSSPVHWRAAGCNHATTIISAQVWLRSLVQSAWWWRGFHAGKPFVLVAQPSLFDDSRAPAGKLCCGRIATKRFQRRYERQDRISDRALRSGVSKHYSRPLCFRSRGVGAAKRQPGGW